MTKEEVFEKIQCAILHSPEQCAICQHKCFDYTDPFNIRFMLLTELSILLRKVKEED